MKDYIWIVYLCSNAPHTGRQAELAFQRFKCSIRLHFVASEETAAEVEERFYSIQRV